MLSEKSKGFSFSSYDWYGSLRGVAFFLLAGLVANIGALETQLNEWGVSAFFTTMILFWIMDLGRRFIRDYRAEQ